MARWQRPSGERYTPTRYPSEAVFKTPPGERRRAKWRRIEEKIWQRKNGPVIRSKIEQEPGAPQQEKGETTVP